MYKQAYLNYTRDCHYSTNCTWYHSLHIQYYTCSTLRTALINRVILIEPREPEADIWNGAEGRWLECHLCVWGRAARRDRTWGRRRVPEARRLGALCCQPAGCRPRRRRQRRRPPAPPCAPSCAPPWVPSRTWASRPPRRPPSGSRPANSSAPRQSTERPASHLQHQLLPVLKGLKAVEAVAEEAVEAKLEEVEEGEVVVVVAAVVEHQSKVREVRDWGVARVEAEAEAESEEQLKASQENSSMDRLLCRAMLQIRTHSELWSGGRASTPRRRRRPRAQAGSQAARSPAAAAAPACKTSSPFRWVPSAAARRAPDSAAPPAAPAPPPTAAVERWVRGSRADHQWAACDTGCPMNWTSLAPPQSASFAEAEGRASRGADAGGQSDRAPESPNSREVGAGDSMRATGARSDTKSWSTAVSLPTVSRRTETITTYILMNS